MSGRAGLAAIIAMVLVATPALAAPSMLQPSGPRSSTIALLFWILLATSALIFVLMMAAFLIGAWRRGVRDGRRSASGGSGVVTVFGAVIPAIVLVVIFGVTLWALTDLSSSAGEADETIDVVAHQWWWEVRYEDQGIVTANEIHIPVGKDIMVRLGSEDVIHSFWVPELSDKLDLLPGHTNTLTFRADEPGTYRGQCAEYCGAQHANMAFLVIADSPRDYASWISLQQEAAAVPESGSLLERGQQVYFNSACMYCHTIAGTSSSGQIGPDLTHLGSREFIGAGMLENNEGNLAGWITNNQSLKPNNRMPNFVFLPEDLQALIAYLGSLD